MDDLLAGYGAPLLDESLREVRLAWAHGIAPDPIYTVTQWADTHRILPQRASAEPGPYRSARTPYFRAPMEDLSITSDVQEIVILKGAQVGATEVANNFVGYVIHHAPGPLMFVLPTDTLAKRSSKQRIAPMIADTPELAARVRPARMRDSGNTLLVKEFPGGVMILTGANSAVGLRSMPARYLILDEMDAYPMDVDKEGDPIELAIRRTATFRAKRKILYISTPKLAGSSRIQNAFEETDQRIYLVPCPYCSHYAPILWRNLRQPGGERWSTDHPPTEVVLYCESCHREIAEHHKTDLLERGRWEPQAEGKPNARGYKLPALYSPIGWYSWHQAATDQLKAKQRGPELMKTWVNTVLGEVYEEEAKRVEYAEVMAIREPYAARVPAAVLVLVAGVDVQHNRLEVGVWGYAPRHEPFAIDHRIIPGDPSTDAVWDKLDELLLNQVYRHESGLDLPIQAAAIDAGYETQQVYEFVAQRQNERDLYAVIGRSGAGRPGVAPPTEKHVERTGRTVHLYTVGIDSIKRWLYNRLRDAMDTPEEPEQTILPAHVPDEHPFDEEWTRQLTAEEEATRFHLGFELKVWRKKSGQKRNEVLDCAVYGRAACLILNPIYDSIAKNLERKLHPEDEPPKPRRRPRKKRWATDF